MKNLTKSVVSYILVLAFVLSFSSNALASEIRQPTVTLTASEEAEVAKTIREMYEDMSPESKKVFLDAITLDATLTAYVQKNVDPSVTQRPRSRAAVVTPIGTLENNLKAMLLPTPVIVCLMAVASGMVAAAADGPLLVGDSYLAVSAVAAAATLVVYWGVVAPKMPQIIRAFQTMFSSSARVITQTFEKLQNDIADLIAKAEIDSIRKKITTKVLKSDGTVDINKFSKKPGGGKIPTWVGPLGWYLERDLAGHGEKYYKLFNYAGDRIASLSQLGKILSK